MASVGRKVKGDYIFTIEKQAAWGTAVDTTAMIGLPCDNLTITLEPGNIVISRADGVRGTSEDVSYNDTSNSIAKAKFKCPLTPALSIALFPGLFQKNVAYSASPAGVFTYIPQAKADLPDPVVDTDAGVFYTIVRRSPIASTSEQISDAVMTTMKLSLDQASDDGLLMVECEFIAPGSKHTLVANPQAACTQASLVTLYKWSGLTTVSLNSSACVTDVIGFELNPTWNAKFQGDSPRGTVIFPRFECKGSIKVMGGGALDVEALKILCRTAAVASQIDLVIDWGDGTPAANGELNLTSHIKMKSYPEETLDMMDGEIVTFDFDGEWGAAGEYPFESVSYYVAP